MDYKYNALEIVSAASKRFAVPNEPIQPKIAVHIEITNSPGENFKIEFDRGKFTLCKGSSSESGGEDLASHMSVLSEEQDNLGRVVVYSGDTAAAEFEGLDQFWDTMFKVC